MLGIDLCSPLYGKYASHRYFDKNECHVDRFCKDNVLLVVYRGVLRFTEDGEACEVGAGEYYVQRSNTEQRGPRPSDEPQYLYIHFDGGWTEDSRALPRRGSFSVEELMPLLDRIDATYHADSTDADRQYLFLKLLLSLRPKCETDTLAHRIAAYVDSHLATLTTLDELCESFHYSKNYIIRVFKATHGKTPIEYLNEQRMKRAMYLLETTNRGIEQVALDSGYQSYSYFYKLFVKKTHLTPYKWRKQKHRNPLATEYL